MYNPQIDINKYRSKQYNNSLIQLDLNICISNLHSRSVQQHKLYVSATTKKIWGFNLSIKSLGFDCNCSSGLQPAWVSYFLDSACIPNLRTLQKTCLQKLFLTWLLHLIPKKHSLWGCDWILLKIFCKDTFFYYCLCP